MKLIWGPPGAGKSFLVMDEVRRLLAAGADDFRLLVPTATMAGHVRHELAREGFAFRPGLVSTLTRFLADFRSVPVQAPAAALPLAVEAALARRTPAAFSKVAAFPGFAAALARLIDEFVSAGCGADRLDELLRRLAIGGEAVAGFLQIWRESALWLRQRGWLLRGELLAELASRIRTSGLPGVRRVFFDGFLTLAGPEVELVRAVAAHAGTVLTLPSWSGAAAARQSLLNAGFEEIVLGEARRPRPRQTIVEARSLADETGEVARRILDQRRRGRRWREMAVIVRRAGAYAGALRTAFHRFGIPARFYFATAAAEHEAIRYVSGVVKAMLGGWDHEDLLAALFTPLSGLGATGKGDRLEFLLRAGLPGRGLEEIRTQAPALYEKLRAIDSWRSESHTPAEWARRAGALRELASPGPPPEPLTQETALCMRSAAEALDVLDQCVEQAAELMESGEPCGFAAFWRAVSAALRLAEVRLEDRRRDVVHVIDAYEARQWELPVVFVCGLLEKEFPLYHSEGLIFDERARSRLAAAGVPVRTSADRQREERFLFDVAVSRATSELVLTWPRYNDKGDENLPSFFLDEFAAQAGVSRERSRAVRPAPEGAPRFPRREPLRDAALRGSLEQRHAVLTPTAIESFLQCPFQFFARHTLALEPPPPLPEERLDLPLQGRILHEVLAELARSPQPGMPLLARIFDRFCDEQRVPAGIRRLAALVELERHLAAVLEEFALPAGWDIEVEKEFDVDLGGLRIRGRMDRVQTDPRTSRAVVVDFKYSSPQSVEENVKAHEAGRLVQGGLYMAALAGLAGIQPAAMVYYGIRQPPTLKGWRCGVPELPATVTDCVPEEFQAVIDRAVAHSRGAAERIRQGRFEVAPADADKCRYCDFADICRVEAAEAQIAAGEGEQ